MDDGDAADRLTRLWVANHEDVARFVARRLDAALVDDVVSETFLVAWRRLDDVPEDARPWLFGVARNVIATRSRSEGRWRALRLRIARQPVEVTRPEDEAAIDRIELEQAWLRLTAGEREVIALVAWDGLTTEQAARVLGLRASTFSVRLTRARRHLVEVLDALATRQPTPSRRP
ncbi:RNA polymerase sigma factor [Antribacter gilvus]|uniref:RNA polymerase sigma factor n=1 Tax=Antribacter gilvus TaxID=2304675 RepID=UPI0013E09820|nr:sigma-70 family RNA polymerase sigma factor [Antribacter gilvus]